MIFPAKLPIKNLALDIDLKELVMAGKRAENARLNVVMNDGVINNAPFSVTLKNTSLTGNFSFRTDGKGVPQFSVRYDATSLDIGALLKELNLADNLVMYVEKSTTDLKTKGRSPGDLLTNLEFSLSAENGKYEYQDPNTGAVLPVFLEKTELKC